METMTDGFTRVRYELPQPGIARIVLARPETHNAQDRQMLYEIDQGLTRASKDDAVKVIILAADGPHFSSGHDLGEVGVRETLDQYSGATQWGGFELPGSEGWMAVEEELFLGLCWRWRNFPKPTIAQVQGKAIAGGLMLAWVCDLIIAAENATFSDPVVAFGVNGHEFFVHAWELGGRRAKEMLFTGAAVTASQALQLGMVNHVVGLGDLEGFSLNLASQIARMPSIGLKLAKQAVNQSLDAQGQWVALRAAFGLHQVGHAHNMQLHGQLIDPGGSALIRELSRG
jgi:enoyl-CoA hydratase